MNLGRALKIYGWMSGPELQFLAYTAAKSNNILEIGSYQGRSTRAMADNSTAKITCVDPWDGKSQIYNGRIHSNGSNEDYSRFWMNLYEYVNRNVIPVRKKFEQFETSEKFDFIFIDAIHEYDALKADISRALPLLTDGGILAGHDYQKGWPGVIKCVDELFPRKQLVDTIWSVEI